VLNLQPSLTSRYLETQLAGDSKAALRLVEIDALGAGMTVPEVQLDIVQPAQREIGRLWEENRISVAQEHLATSISQVVLSHLYPRLPRKRSNGMTAVVACVEGELHDMGGRIGADFLEMAGFDVRFLGANVKERDLLEVVGDAGADLVGLSGTMSFHVPALISAIENLRKLRGSDFPILVGGGVLKWAPELAGSTSLMVAGADADELVSRCLEYFDR
jgi:methanogenic corrinoid protein MtbC1